MHVGTGYHIVLQGFLLIYSIGSCSLVLAQDITLCYQGFCSDNIDKVMGLVLARDLMSCYQGRILVDSNLHGFYFLITV